MPRQRMNDKRRNRRSSNPAPRIYEPLEQRVLMCYEPHGMMPIAPTLPATTESQPAVQTTTLKANNTVQGGGGGTTDGGTPLNIVWTNRGQASDNFAATFGGNAAQARGVVDAVIAQYERIISSMNWTGGATQYSVNISMRNQSAGNNGDFGGQCPPGQVGIDASGAPVSATIFLGRGQDTNGDDLGDGAGWYLDPTPNDFAEFTNVVNGFVGTAGAGSPAAGLRDFYSLVAHEMGHAMGMTSATGSDWRTNLGAFAVDSGVADANGAGNLWAYSSASVGRAVLTDSDLNGQGVIGVHSAVPAQSFNFNAQTYTAAADVMNNTFNGINGRRLLISNLLIGTINDVANYDVVWPEQFGSMYTSLNTTTGQLTLRGGAGNSNDDFSVVFVDNMYQVTVDIGTDVAGTGPTDAFVSLWTDAQVSSIVIEAGGGDDWIEIRTLTSGEPVTIDAGAGNDEIRLAIGDFDTDLLSDIDIAGGTGTDEIWINDLVDGAGSDVYTLTSTSFSKPSRTATFSSIERIELLGSDNDDTYHIESFGGAELIVDGQDGDDTFNITQPGGDLDALAARTTLLGGAGADTLNLYDASDTAADNYLFDPAGADNLTFTKPAAGAFQGMLHSSMQTILLQANGSHNNITVTALTATDVTFNGNGGNDTLELGAGSLELNLGVTDLAFNGGAGTDAMILDDSADTGDDTHVFDTTLLSSTYRKVNDTLVVTYTGLEDATLDTSNATNLINVHGLPLGTDLSILGNLGQDRAVIGGGDISDNVRGAVSFDAFLNGTVVFNDENGNVGSHYVLDGGQFTAGGITHDFSNVAHVQLHTSQFGDNITVEGTFGYDVLLHANAGNDLIRWGGGSVAFMSDATIYGGDGGDELFLDDTTTFAPTTFMADQGGGLPFVEMFNGNTTVIYDSIAELTIEAGPHDDTIRSAAFPTSTRLRLRGHGGADTIDVQGHPSLNSSLFQPVVVDGGAGLDNVEVNTDGQGGARAEFLTSQDLASLAIGTSGRLALAPGERVIDVTTSVSMPASGFVLDLSDGFFVRRGIPSFPFYRDRVAVGYNAGAWNGLGINSSHAAASAESDGLGMARASELFNGGGGVLAGINLAANDIVIRHTLYGDANLDGTVNLADFNRVASNFGGSGTTWAQGNFNYDNSTNLADFNALAANFGNSAAPDALPTGPGISADELLKMLEQGGGATA